MGILVVNVGFDGKAGGRRDAGGGCGDCAFEGVGR